MPTAAELAAAARGGESKYDDADVGNEGYIIAFAPAGPLGFSMESPDATSMMVHSIKSTSPLVDQVKTGDRLIGVDDVDVRNLSPNRIVNLLATRKANMWRKLTLLRRGATVSNLGDSTLQLEEGIIVVYVPATKLGFSLNSVDDGAPIFEIVKEDSILADTVRVGDRLVRIDEKDTSTMHAGSAVKILGARKTNPYRRLVIQRGSGVVADSNTVIATPVSTPMMQNMDGDKYTVIAPAGKLGVILDNPDDGAPVIHTVKETSPLLGKINVGDRLVNIDNVDVSGYTPAQVVQLLSTKSNNPERLLTMLRPAPMTTAEPEIVVGNDGESTVGGEYIEDTGDEATAATGEKQE
jgi:C-terminal processing protease CtpA/Prc